MQVTAESFRQKFYSHLAVVVRNILSAHSEQLVVECAEVFQDDPLLANLTLGEVFGRGGVVAPRTAQPQSATPTSAPRPPPTPTPKPQRSASTIPRVTSSTRRRSTRQRPITREDFENLTRSIMNVLQSEDAWFGVREIMDHLELGRSEYGRVNRAINTLIEQSMVKVHGKSRSRQYRAKFNVPVPPAKIPPITASATVRRRPAAVQASYEEEVIAVVQKSPRIVSAEEILAKVGGTPQQLERTLKKLLKTKSITWLEAEQRYGRAA